MSERLERISDPFYIAGKQLWYSFVYGYRPAWWEYPFIYHFLTRRQSA